MQNSPIRWRGHDKIKGFIFHTLECNATILINKIVMRACAVTNLGFKARYGKFVILPRQLYACTRSV